jgi:hypothetical protein
MRREVRLIRRQLLAAASQLSKVEADLIVVRADDLVLAGLSVWEPDHSGANARKLFDTPLGDRLKRIRQSLFDLENDIEQVVDQLHGA